MGIKHIFQSTKSEQSDPTLVGPTAWNNNHTIDSEFNIPVVASPATPGSGVNEYAATAAGRPQLATLGPLGLANLVQTQLGRRRFAMWVPVPNQTTVNQLGCSASAAVGTPTARNPASTNLFTSMTRTGYVSAAATNSAAGTVDNNANSFWRGNAAGAGGFFCVWRFGISDAVFNSNGAMFVGLGVGVVMSGQPSALTNVLGVGCDSADTQLQLYSAGGSAQARVALGANFPCNTISTDVYELMLYAPPNGSNVQYQVTRLNTGHVTTGTISNAANLPASTQFLGPACQRFTGATATAVGIDMFGFYAEVDN
jgi:hypothetical protein